MFRPTHEITFTPSSAQPQTFRVMLDEEMPGKGGLAYTEQEWETETRADWAFDPEAGWTFQGQATPGGANGTVEVIAL